MVLIKLQDDVTKIDQQIRSLIRQIQDIFKRGQTKRTGNEESYFAYQVDRFADIYMPTLADLLATSPRTYFRAKRRHLAHEMSLALSVENYADV